jgi:hypothetical protein
MGKRTVRSLLPPRGSLVRMGSPRPVFELPGRANRSFYRRYGLADRRFIDRQTLSRVIERNTGLTLQRNVFRDASSGL